MTVEDPEFTDDDLAAAVAFEDDKAARCSGCGHHRDESMATGADQDYEAEARTCHACAAVAKSIRAAHQGEGTFDDDGVYWLSEKRRG